MYKLHKNECMDSMNILKKIFPHVDHADVSLLNDEFNIHTSDANLDSIFVDINYGRFANNYIILRNIICFSLFFKIKYIYISIENIMFSFRRVPLITKIKDKSSIEQKTYITPHKGADVFLRPYAQ